MRNGWTGESDYFFKSPAREITCKVDVYDYDNHSTLIKTLLPNQELVKVTIERSAPKDKFFGFAISQKLTIEALGNLSSYVGLWKGSPIQPFFNYAQGDESSMATFPIFYVENITVDSVANKTTIEAYDLLEQANKKVIGKIKSITYPVTLYDYLDTICTYIGADLELDSTDALAAITFDNDEINIDGTETLKEILAAAAEFLGAVCVCRENNTIAFRRLYNSYGAVIQDTLYLTDYFDFTIKTNNYLDHIASVTALGENFTTAATADTEVNQILYDNPFLTLRKDITTILNLILEQVRGTKMCSYTLKHRGTPYYEAFDYIRVIDRNGDGNDIFPLNETFIYDGGLSVTWSNENTGNTQEITAQPTNISTALKTAFAKVDKMSGEITLMASQIDTLDPEAIEQLTQAVIQTITPSEVEMIVQQTLDNGVSEVTTTTGYTFNKEGLTISKSDSDLSTQITENGMNIYDETDSVLTVNNEGVTAKNLHANTFLIIGKYSRLEDYEKNGATRTGCFWIG